MGTGGIGRAYVSSPEPGLVFGSADPVAAEAFALALLKDIKTSVPFWLGLLERIILFSES